MWTCRENATIRRFVVSMEVCILISFAHLTLIGCTPNQPYRIAEPVEKHDGFDLAFVEFTDRGNVFDRKSMNQVLDYVTEQARYYPNNPDQGVITIVFVHGWKHNASYDDGNVMSFRKFLRQIHDMSKVTPIGSSRKVIGIYVGWRGLSISLNPLSNFSYWNRKSAAQQVATGDVPELILRLKREIFDDARPNRNLFLVTGHSFGGAIVLSALKSFFLEQVVEASAKITDDGCVKTRPFGHGVVLLNPAIEANKVFQLKELVAETCFVPGQVPLMHVISSDADLATNKAFRLGQWLGGSLFRRQATLTREFDGQEVQFQESDLDTITVGNFMPFQTGQLDHSNSSDGGWDYRSCIGSKLACIDPVNEAQHFPAKPNEPLAFIQTDESFIADHNDVFNDNVSAYLAAMIAGVRYKQILGNTWVVDPRLPNECRSDEFGPCFDLYQRWFESVE